MAARIDIPLTFPEGATPGLRRDLERFSNGVYNYAQAAPRLFAARIAPLPRAIASLAYDVAVPVLTAGTFPLPRPEAINGGRTCGIIRQNTTPVILVTAVGCLVDGRSIYRLTHELGYTGFYFDGSNYWSTRAGLAWNE